MLVMQHCRLQISMYQSLKILTSQFQKMSILTPKLLSNNILKSRICSRYDTTKSSFIFFQTQFGYIDRSNMETKPAFSAAVVEVLKQDNYLDWSVRVKTYLMAQDIWDIVESRSNSPTPENEAAFKVGARRMPWLYMWSRFHAGQTHFLISGRLFRPELLGIPWQESTNLKVLTQVAGNLDHSIR